jgi:choline dehydrogenase-like flavoprotein
MSPSIKKLEADVVIAGAGPGGATIARELSKAGKKVILIEKGKYRQKATGHLALFRSMERLGLTYTVEGANYLQGIGVGGSSLLSAGTSVDPYPEDWKKYGIDLTEETKEARNDCWIHQAPKSYVGPATNRLVAAADAIGQKWERIDKFIDLANCKRCYDCLLGCSNNAKWSGVVFAEEALKNGATLLTEVNVKDVIVENNIAGGVRAYGLGGQSYEIRGKTIVSSAGALGSARILQRSGIKDAGNSFTGDPSIMAFGFLKRGIGNMKELVFSVGYHDKPGGVFFGNVCGPKWEWRMQAIKDEKLRGFGHALRYGSALGVWAKIADEMVGKVYLEEGKVSKPLTKRDLERKRYSKDILEKVLIKAGCEPNNFYHSAILLPHPGGTAPIGKVVNSDLETSIKNLYCCDSSVFPEGFGIPPILTIVALAKRLSKRLNNLV